MYYLRIIYRRLNKPTYETPNLLVVGVVAKVDV